MIFLKNWSDIDLNLQHSIIKMLQHFSLQYDNKKWNFLEIEITHDLFEKRPDFNLKHSISKMLQHFSPSALALWRPWDIAVPTKCSLDIVATLVFCWVFIAM